MLESARKVKSDSPNISKIHRYRPTPVVERADTANYVDTTGEMEHSIAITSDERYFALLKQLGAGAYGVVKKAINLCSGQILVAKIERLEDTIAYYQELYLAKLIAQKLDEVDIQLKLENERMQIATAVLAQITLEEQVNKALGRFHGSLYRKNIQGINKRYLFIDYVDAQNLYEQNHTLALVQESLDVGLKILEALQALHAIGYYHADLNLWNILYSPIKTDVVPLVHIIDFGCALKIEAEKPAQGRIRGTHIAPELFAQDEVSDQCDFTQQTEVFAAGMILYELLSKDVFDAYRDKKFVDYKRAYQEHYQAVLLKLKAQPDVPWCKMVQEMIAPDPKERPSLTAVILNIGALLNTVSNTNNKVIAQV